MKVPICSIIKTSPRSASVKRGGGVTFGHVRIYYPSLTTTNTSNNNTNPQEFKNNEQSRMPSKEPYRSIDMDEYELMKLNQRYFTAGSIGKKSSQKLKRRPILHSSVLSETNDEIQTILQNVHNMDTNHIEELIKWMDHPSISTNTSAASTFSSTTNTRTTSTTLDVQGAIVQSLIIDKLQQQKQSHGKERKHYSNKECILQHGSNSSNINHIQNARSA
jgi:hypothetical protein